MVVFEAPTPRFTPKHAWSFKNNALCGICASAWAECLFRHRKHVEWRQYWQRVLFITMISLFNSLLGLVESMLHGQSIERQRVHPRPLFVLGHPRTGTTLLQAHLARDSEEFGVCSTFCAGFPSAFLWFERFKWVFSGAIDSKRPMDNMALSFDAPQEDELAISVLSSGISPYMPLSFMTDEPSFRPYFSFRSAPAAATARWVASFLYMCRKLTIRAAGKRLLLKSPA